MSLSYKLGQQGACIPIKLSDSSISIPNNKGLATPLTNTSSGLVIATKCDNEAAWTVYSQAGSTIDTIATPGTYAAPTSGHCRFAAMDATNAPGWYELQFANSRLAVAGAKILYICIPAQGSLNLAQGDREIPLTDIDPYSRAWQFQAPMTENYSAFGTAPTPEQHMMETRGLLLTSAFVGTTLNVKGLDGVTIKYTCSIDSASSPTLINRVT